MGRFRTSVRAWWPAVWPGALCRLGEWAPVGWRGQNRSHWVWWSESVPLSVVFRICPIGCCGQNSESVPLAKVVRIGPLGEVFVRIVPLGEVIRESVPLSEVVSVRSAFTMVKFCKAS